MTQPTKMTRILVICLLVVVVGFALARGGLLRGVATYGIFLLCPLMHVGMMLFMGHGMHSHSHGAEKDGEEDRTKACH